ENQYQEHSLSNLTDLKERVLQLLKNSTIDLHLFKILKLELIQFFDSESVHILDNLALLSKKDNSALNNSIFPVKRKKIIALEKEGKFIPITTKHVFLKYYSDSDLQPYYWSKADKELYFKNIQSTLSSY